jgi:hypothetical protein
MAIARAKSGARIFFDERHIGMLLFETRKRAERIGRNSRAVLLDTTL